MQQNHSTEVWNYNLQIHYPLFGVTVSTTTDKSRSGWPYRLIIAGCSLIVVYVLSFGPATSLAVRGRIPNPPVVAFYRAIPGRLQVPLLELWSRVDPVAALALNGERARY